MLDKFRYFILRALRNMRQWPFLCSASILTMAIALATVATFFLVVVNIDQLATRWTKEIQVVAYLQNLQQHGMLLPLPINLKVFLKWNRFTMFHNQQLCSASKNI